MHPWGGDTAPEGTEDSRDTLGWVTSPAPAGLIPLRSEESSPEPKPWGTALPCPVPPHLQEQWGEAGGLCSPRGDVGAAGGVSPPRCPRGCTPSPAVPALPAPCLASATCFSSSHGNLREEGWLRAEPAQQT